MEIGDGEVNDPSGNDFGLSLGTYSEIRSRPEHRL